MNTLVICGLINAVIASLLAIGAIFATWSWRNPYATRVIWLVVLLRFIVPPIFAIQLPWLTDSVDQQVASTKSVSSSRQKFAKLPSTISESKDLRSSLVEKNSGPTASTELPATLPQEESSLAELAMSSSMLFTVGCIWLLGALLIAAFVLHRIWRFHNLIRKTRIAPNSLQQRVNQVAARIGVSREIQVRLTDGSTPPLVWCLGKQPIIVLPSALMGLFEDSMTTSILAHEVMHVHRKDSWFRWLEILAVSLYWWCPFSWTARRMLQEAEERCCDADVLRSFPELRKSYANALLETLEFLAGAGSLNFAGTGFARNSSLKRRFEMIVRSDTQVRPATLTRMFMFVAALVLITTTPVVSSSATALPESMQAVAPADHIKMERRDGTLLEGQVITLGNDRIIVARDTRKVAAETKPEKKETSRKSTVWNVSLDECFKIALENDSKIQLSSDANGLLLIAPHSKKEITALDFRVHAENIIRDLDVAYWISWLALRDLEAQKAGRDRALETWRKVKALRHVGATGGESDREAQSRAYYFLLQTQVENQVAEHGRTQSLLRYMLGLNSEDGQVINPTDTPQVIEHRFDWDAIREDAINNRNELARQRWSVKRRRLELESSQKNFAVIQAKNAGDQSDDSGSQAENHTSEQSLNLSMGITKRKELMKIRHYELLLARELAVQKDLELEASHQLGDAVRAVDLTFVSTQISRNRSKAAQEECKALEAVYDSGRVSLDLLLDCQRRKVEAEKAYNQARVDYARSLSRVHRRKGTLLTRHGIAVKQDK